MSALLVHCGQMRKNCNEKPLGAVTVPTENNFSFQDRFLLFLLRLKAFLIFTWTDIFISQKDLL